jgi:hypothetical protein
MAALWSNKHPGKACCGKATPDPEPELLRSSGAGWFIIILAKSNTDAG